MGLVDKESDRLILEVSLLGSNNAKKLGPGSGRTGLPVARETNDRKRSHSGRHAVVYRNAAPNRRDLALKGAHRL